MDMLSREQAVGGMGPGGMGVSRVPPERSACFLCDYWRSPRDDEMNHVIVRTGLPVDPPGGVGVPPASASGGLILLNKYPYANGHLLVCLGDGRPRLLDYDEAQRQEFWSLVDLAVDLVERALNPQGVNIGVNQGNAAGAGVPGHVHAHVVPRWAGDVNFMSVCADVRVIPGALDRMAETLRASWDAVRRAGVPRE